METVFIITAVVVVLLSLVILYPLSIEGSSAHDERIINHLQLINSREFTRENCSEDEHWIKNNVIKIGENSAALKILNTSVYLEELFLKCHKNASTHIAFQKHLISVKKVEGIDRSIAEFSNLICAYLKRWDFAPEIKELIFKDEQYQSIIKLYKMFRIPSTGELIRCL